MRIIGGGGGGRRTALAAVTAGALFALAGCGGSDSASDSGSGSGSGDAKSGGTRTVKDTLNGTVQDVPKKPKRVVALWRTGTELADMGVRPVAALEGEFLKEELGGKTFAKVKNVPTVGTFEGVDVEKVMEAKPDLIVGMDNGGLSIDYKELQDIAPTVIFKIKEPPDVWKNYPKLADVLGRSTDFNKRNAALDKSLAAVERRYGKKTRGAKAVHLSASAGSTWVSTKKSLAWKRLDAAGFGYLGTYTDKPKRYVEELSSENIPKLADADMVFYSVDLYGKTTPDMDKVLESESFKRLPAAKAGNVFPVTAGTIYTFPAGDRQVEDLKKAAEKYKPAGGKS
ncbi:ABC transporter substrate-binding protein [Streptomyces sp. NPDC048172]|uniref:ABC transporter substrate-binding protein n=1 Tax=Streptomyces sp. NPDC048172 TaxID=3365505 RepID=UPI003723DCF7